MSRRRPRWTDDDEEYRDGKRLPKGGRRLQALNRADSFTCQHCRVTVPHQGGGTKNRNHCPRCLWSRHVDQAIGDRASTCLASMQPVALTLKADGGELMVVHHCCGCGKVSWNRLAADDNEEVILTLAGAELATTVERKMAALGVLPCRDLATVTRFLWGDAAPSQITWRKECPDDQP